MRDEMQLIWENNEVNFPLLEAYFREILGNNAFECQLPFKDNDNEKYLLNLINVFPVEQVNALSNPIETAILMKASSNLN